MLNTPPLLKTGWLGWARTSDPLINSQMLLPTELLANILYFGAHRRDRTADILITNQVLYQLS